MPSPNRSPKETDLERTLDMLDSLLKAVQREADKLPDPWQQHRCDDFADKLNDAKRIAKEALELW